MCGGAGLAVGGARGDKYRIVDGSRGGFSYSYAAKGAPQGRWPCSASENIDVKILVAAERLSPSHGWQRATGG
jgi:hypothetical protein